MTTPTTLVDLCQEILLSSGPLKARELAARIRASHRLGGDSNWDLKRDLNRTVLYPHRGSLFQIDSDYRWTVVGRPAHAPRTVPIASPAPTTSLADSGPGRSLYAWQTRALQAWEAAGFRGVFEVTTGAGKTRFALAAMSRVLRRPEGAGARFSIVVPTVVLRDQWRRAIAEDLGVPAGEIAVRDGQERGTFANPRTRFVIWVLNTAARHLCAEHGRFAGRGPLGLIVDECHRAGADKFSAALEAAAEFRMGLSATPERWNDDNLQTRIAPMLGPVVFRYTREEAVRDGVLPPLRALNCGFELDAPEQGKYLVMTREIGLLLNYVRSRYGLTREKRGLLFGKLARIHAESPDPKIARLMGLSDERKSLLADAPNRRASLRELLARLGEHKVIVFHETIAAAIQTHREVGEQGGSAMIYHSAMPDKERCRQLQAFEGVRKGVLCAVQALDLGLDVGSADVGINYCPVSSQVRLVQRYGRVSRKHVDKPCALFFNLYAMHTSEERSVAFRSTLNTPGVLESLTVPCSTALDFRLWSMETSAPAA